MINLTSKTALFFQGLSAAATTVAAMPTPVIITPQYVVN